MKNLGIMGGTFDPIHYGHLVAAEEARVKFKLEKVIFVPVGIPPHKKDYQITGAEHRYTMTVLATSPNSHFHTSRWEVEKTTPSYTVETLKEFNKIYRNHNLYFITGADAIWEILTWHKKEELKKLCSFIAASRPGYPEDEIHQEVSKNLTDAIYTMKIPALAISSSDIRQRVREKRPIKYLLPTVVEAYIYKHKLYLR